jgi:hypothetical protein
MHFSAPTTPRHRASAHRPAAGEKAASSFTHNPSIHRRHVPNAHKARKPITSRVRSVETGRTEAAEKGGVNSQSRPQNVVKPAVPNPTVSSQENSLKV